MIITCPCEKKQFKIDESLIPQEGRELQCGTCERVWFYKPENEKDEPLTLNENITKDKPEQIAEKKDKNFEFSKQLPKEEKNKTETKEEKSNEISKSVEKSANKDFKILLFILPVLMTSFFDASMESVRFPFVYYTFLSLFLNFYENHGKNKNPNIF